MVNDPAQLGAPGMAGGGLRPEQALLRITLAVMMAMSLWLTASALAPTLASWWHLSLGDTLWVTSAVQLGFVAGALLSATMGLPDRVPPRTLFTVAALAAALANGLFIWLGSWAWLGLGLRFLTGMALAGVYPVAVQLVAGWFPRGRGLATGILISGLVLGSALPHLMLSLGALGHWQWLMGGCSILALAGAALVRWLPDSPQPFRPPAFRWGDLGAVLHDRPVMLANLGYFGHNWELYAMWSWLPLFLLQSLSPYWHGAALDIRTAWVAFIGIGLAGALGSLLGGWAADRWGRTITTVGALAVSGGCTLLIGGTYGGVPWVTVLVVLLWGTSVVADSAQFSTAVTELSDRDRLGSALTLQMAIGFLITMGSIGCVGWLLPLVGWQWAFWPLVLGPVAGIAAMLSLRRRPEAIRLAHGRR